MSELFYSKFKTLLTILVVTTPHALWMVVRWRMHGLACLLSIVDGSSTVHGLTTVVASTICVCLTTSFAFLFDFQEVLLVNGNDFALRAELNLCRLVISVCHTTSVALELTFSDHYDLTYQFVSHKTILIGNGS